MRDSKIFKPSEQAEIERQKKGNYSDKYGLFSRCIKPKIIEILSFDRKWLKRLIKPKRKTKKTG